MNASVKTKTPRRMRPRIKSKLKLLERGKITLMNSVAGAGKSTQLEAMIRELLAPKNENGEANPEAPIRAALFYFNIKNAEEAYEALKDEPGVEGNVVISTWDSYVMDFIKENRERLLQALGSYMEKKREKKRENKGEPNPTNNTGAGIDPALFEVLDDEPEIYVDITPEIIKKITERVGSSVFASVSKALEAVKPEADVEIVDLEERVVRLKEDDAQEEGEGAVEAEALEALEKQLMRMKMERFYRRMDTLGDDVVELMRQGLRGECSMPLDAAGLIFWALSLHMGFRMVAFDEVQDIDAKTYCVLTAQLSASSLVLSGDFMQSIYGFRNCINALKHAKKDFPDRYNEVNLNKSFRFGKHVAKLASRASQLAGVEREVKGTDRVSVVGCSPHVGYECPCTAWSQAGVREIAILCKTNNAVFRYLLAMAKCRLCARREKRPMTLTMACHDGFVDNAFEVLRSMPPSKELARLHFARIKNSLSRIQKYPSPAVRFIEFLCFKDPFDIGNVLNALKRMLKPVEDPSAFRVSVMTIHRSKGLEFDNVLCAQDVPIARVNACLFYVMFTRARERILLHRNHYTYFTELEPPLERKRKAPPPSKALKRSGIMLPMNRAREPVQKKAKKNTPGSRVAGAGKQSQVKVSLMF